MLRSLLLSRLKITMLLNYFSFYNYYICLGLRELRIWPFLAHVTKSLETPGLKDVAWNEPVFFSPWQTTMYCNPPLGGSSEPNMWPTEPEDNHAESRGW